MNTYQIYDSNKISRRSLKTKNRTKYSMVKSIVTYEILEDFVNI